MRVRQMCGGGTWDRDGWRPRRAGGAWILDAPGIAIVTDPDADWGPFACRLHGPLLRDRVRDRLRPSCWWPRGHHRVWHPEPGWYCGRCGIVDPHRRSLVARPGWPDRAGGARDVTGRLVHHGGLRWSAWLRIGPWVVGDVDAWDESGAP